MPSRAAAGDRAVHLAAGLFGGAEAAVGQHGLHVFAGVAGQRDFEIVDRGGAIQREARGIAAAHQIEQHGREAALDHVAAHAPEDGAPALPAPRPAHRSRARKLSPARMCGSESSRPAIPLPG